MAEVTGGLGLIREAVEADLPRIDAFLAAHSETSMYLRGNLEAHGIGLGTHSHSTQVFLWENGAEFGAFAITKSGYLMAQMPNMTKQAAHAFAQAIEGRHSLGMTGAVSQVQITLQSCGLDDAPMALFHDEPLYRMALHDLAGPNQPSRPVGDVDHDLLEPWVAAYLVDTGQDIPEGAATNAPERTREAIEDGNTRLLLHQGEPVAMARINAKAGDTVQVGGVFVPEMFRGQGFGGQVTRAVLAEEKKKGAQTAVLFANNATAAKTYERIGFEKIGRYRIALLQAAREVRT